MSRYGYISVTQYKKASLFNENNFQCKIRPPNVAPLTPKDRDFDKLESGLS